MNPYPLAIVLSTLLLTQGARSIEIDLRYDYDTNGFFNQPGAKETLRMVADYYEALIHDSLQGIDNTQWPSGNTWSAVFEHPGTGSETSIANLKVPADTIIIFAGGRSLGTPAGRGGFGGYYYSSNQIGWSNLLAARGQSGALNTPKTDFGPWGGAITFNTASPWNFSVSGPVNSTLPFVSIALHELGHVLGIGSAPSWQAKVSGTSFTGAYAKQAYGGVNVPLHPGGAHWRDDAQCVLPDGYVPGEPNNVLSKAFGSFGAPHGFAQIALMDPGTCTAGAFHKVMTDLDLAALRDIGWQLEPPLAWTNVQASPAGPLSLSWASTSGLTYRVQKSISLAAGSWSDLHSVAGNGSVQSYNAAAPSEPRAFYRLQTSPLAFPATVVFPPDPVGSQSIPPVTVGGCHCGESWGCD